MYVSKYKSGNTLFIMAQVTINGIENIMGNTSSTYTKFQVSCFKLGNKSLKTKKSKISKKTISINNLSL